MKNSTESGTLAYKKMTALKSCLAGLACMLIMDTIWLGVLMGPHYREMLEGIMVPPGGAPDGVWLAAALVYGSMLASIWFYVVKPLGFPGNSLLVTVKGAGLGFIIFSVYEGTNYSFVQNWSLNMVFIDILWGVCLFGLTSWVMYRFASADQ